MKFRISGCCVGKKTTVSQQQEVGEMEETPQNNSPGWTEPGS